MHLLISSSQELSEVGRLVLSKEEEAEARRGEVKCARSNEQSYRLRLVCTL